MQTIYYELPVFVVSELETELEEFIEGRAPFHYFFYSRKQSRSLRQVQDQETQTRKK